MKNNVVGIVISVIVLFMSLIVLPTYFIGIVNWRNDRAICLSAARNFVDMVIDNGYVSEKALADLNLSIASCSTTYSYEYYREEKITNPGVIGGDDFETTWVYVEVTPDTKWRKGDIVTIVITQESVNIFQRIAASILGTPFYDTNIRIPGMVR